jgi:AcrR family transcriptional regulator
MPRSVKKRPYHSAVRAEQAARTRDRIVEAAAGLFESEGYGRTTVRAIAEAAGVAPDTVYATFGSKIRVLTAIIDARLAPAGEQSVLDRPEVAEVRDERDQRRQLELFARDMSVLVARVGPVYEILRTAAAVEPGAAAVFAEMDGQRFANLSNVARFLAANGQLRVEVDRAAEIIWALASPDVARLLRQGRGWSDDEYAQWLADTLTRTLIPDRMPQRR